VSEKMTRKELADKVDWEGGVHEAIAGYGIPPARLPGDVPADVLEAWKRVYDSTSDIDLIDDWLYPTEPDQE